MGKINMKGLSSFNNPQVVEEDKTQAKENSISRVEVRKALIQDVKNAAETLNELGLQQLGNQVIGLVKHTLRSRFSVSFVGEFNHGKSTLINKLLGRDILPTGTLPTTALLTQITSGNDDSIKVLNRLGKEVNTLPLTYASWEELVAYKENGEMGFDKGENDAAFVRLTLKDDWINKYAIDILDTPGANDGSKDRDKEISRALMVTDGAVLCVDAQKGLMETQRAFIKDRLLGTKIPYIALAITHLDLISMENRDRMVAYIMGILKGMKIEMPVFIVNEVEMPSDMFEDKVGIDKLKDLIVRWSKNPNRADKLESWLAVNVCHVLDMATKGITGQRKILEAKDADRKVMLVENKAAIIEMNKHWEDLRGEIKKRCEACKAAFAHRYDHEVRTILADMEYRISVAPDPKKWYEKSYRYELSNRLTASLISLDNVVTENARNDFEWLNRQMLKQFKINAERDPEMWKRTEETSFYSHKESPDMEDLGDVRKKENYKTGAAVIVSSVVLGILTGGIGGGIVGSVGVGTLMRQINEKNLSGIAEQMREQLREYIKSDIPNVLHDATTDCEHRIEYIYRDILAGAHQTESNWTKMQYNLIDQASKPSEDACKKALENIDIKLSKIKEIINKLSKFIK